MVGATSGMIERRRRVVVRLAIGLVLSLLMLFAAGALFLASSAGKTLVLGPCPNRFLIEFGVEATRRGARLPAWLARRHAARHQRQAIDSGASLPHRATHRGRYLARYSPRIPLGPPARYHQAGSRAGLRNADCVRWSGREFTHHPPQPFPVFDIHDGQVHDLALTSVRPNGTRVAVRGLSLSFAGEGPGAVRGTVVVSDGWSVTRGTSQIGFDRARADMSLAGTSLALTSITMESPVAVIGGTAHLDVARGDLDAKYDARVALGDLQTWLPEVPPLEGELEASGTIGGTLDRSRSDLRRPGQTPSVAGGH